MNDNLPRDPELLAFEAQLATLRPKISREQEHQLLYACAFSAGESAATSSLSRWRLAAGLLSILTLSFAASAWQRPAVVATQPVVPQKNNQPESPPKSASAESLAVAPKPVEINLDAWRVSPDRTPFGQRVIQVAYDDPHLRSLTVSAMTRAASHE